MSNTSLTEVEITLLMRLVELSNGGSCFESGSQAVREAWGSYSLAVSSKNFYDQGIISLGLLEEDVAKARRSIAAADRAVKIR
jgi:hypothetical protein